MSSWLRRLLSAWQLGDEIGADRTERSTQHKGNNVMSIIISRVLSRFARIALSEVPHVVSVFLSRATGHLFTLINRLARCWRRLRVILLQRGVVVNFAPKAGTGAGRRVQDMSELEIFG